LTRPGIPVNTLPPPPTNGTDEVLPPPAEKPVKVPDPAPVPQEKLTPDTTIISDVQQQRFVAHCRKHGMSEIGLNRWLRDNGINGVANIPLSKA
jgi:hypothetical protein